MTSKEALECLKPSRWDDKEKINAYEVLEELVRRDTPDKPLLVEVNAHNVHHYECLYCGATINIGGTIGYNKVFNKFCRECGQRLDWS
jgi:hypothetical protein